MKVRQYTLPVLQNLLKRDPSAYKEEFEAIWKQYLAALEAFRLDAGSAGRLARDSDARRLGELATFVSHCGVHYPDPKSRFAPGLVAFLRDRAPTLAPELRGSLARACLLARAKGLLDPAATFGLCFDLVRSVSDKPLRALLAGHIVGDARRAAKAGGAQPTKAFQRLVFAAAEDRANAGSATGAKVAVDALVELYGRGVWTGPDAVNCLGRCCVDDRARIACTAIHFFLGVDRAPILDDESSDDEDDPNPSGDRGKLVKEAVGAVDKHQHSKKTKGKARKTKKALARAKKLGKRDADKARPAFPAIQLLDDPHRICDALLARARRQVDGFEVRVAMLEFVSRVACAHKLQLLPFYSYMRRYLAPHQPQAPRLLAIFAQACHDLVPPDEIAPAARHVADAFVSDRNAPEAMALGINALREVAGRCPALLDEPEMLGFVRDLASYAKHRDKSVVMAARGWINLVREHYPALLQKKDRGRGAAASKKAPAKFGASAAATGVDGEELLRAYERGDLPEEFDDAVQECDDLGERPADDAGWVDVDSDDDDGGGGSDGWVDVASDDDGEPAAGAGGAGDGWVDASDSDDSSGDDDDDDDGAAADGDGWVDALDSDDGGDSDGGDCDSDDDDDDGGASDGESDAGDKRRVRFEDGVEAGAGSAAPRAPPRVLDADDFARIKLLRARAEELTASGGRAAARAGAVVGDDLVPEAVKRRTTVLPAERRSCPAVLALPIGLQEDGASSPTLQKSPGTVLVRPRDPAGVAGRGAQGAQRFR